MYRLINVSMEGTYFLKFYENHYKNIVTKILVEDNIAIEADLQDYKFLFFEDEPHYC